MADSTITSLADLPAPLATDILPIVSDPAGTPATKKATVANLGTVFRSGTPHIVGTGDGTGTPGAGTLRGPAAVGTNIAGVSLTFDAPTGTGSGAGGALIWRTAPVGTTGSTAHALAEAARIDPYGHLGIHNTLPTNAYLYIGNAAAAADNMVDQGSAAAPMGIKATVTAVGAQCVAAAQFQSVVPAGITGGTLAMGSVSRVTVGDTAGTGDAVGVWGDCFLSTAAARNIWGGNIYAYIDAGVAYTNTAVGCEIGLFNNGSVLNAGGPLHAVVGGTGGCRFGIYISGASSNFQQGILMPDGTSGPSDNFIYCGPVGAGNVPTGAAVRFSVDATGRTRIGSTFDTNAWLYIGAGTGSLVDADGVMGVKARVDTTVSATTAAAHFNTNIISGSASGPVYGSVSRVDVNDVASGGDAVGLWGDCFIWANAARDTWGANIYCFVPDNVTYNRTAVGAEIGCFNWGTTTNPGGSLTVTCNGDTDSRFGIYQVSQNNHVQNAFLVPDGMKGPNTNFLYFGALDIANAPTGTTPKLQFTKGGLLGLGTNPTYGLHQLGGSMRLAALANTVWPTVTPVGTTGATTYTYWMVAADAAGNMSSQIATSGATTTGNAALSAANFNRLTFTPVPNAAKYYFLKKATAPTAGAAESILMGTWTGTGIQGVTVLHAGAGMSAVPTVSFPTYFGNPGSGATATANTTGTAPTITVTSVVVTANGANYNLNTAVSFTVAGFTSPYAYSALSGSAVAATAVLYGGDKFTAPPTISFSGGGGSGATATAVMGVSSVTLGSGGTGYTNGTNYALGFSGGAGSGAAGLFDVVGGAVTNIRLTRQLLASGLGLTPTSGTGYTTAPTVSFAAAGAGSGATPTVSLGVNSVTMTAGGTAYATAPVPLFTVGAVTFPVATTNPLTAEFDDYGQALTSFTNPIRNFTADVLLDGQIGLGTTTPYAVVHISNFGQQWSGANLGPAILVHGGAANRNPAIGVYDVNSQNPFAVANISGVFTVYAVNGTTPAAGDTLATMFTVGRTGSMAITGALTVGNAVTSLAAPVGVTLNVNNTPVTVNGTVATDQNLMSFSVLAGTLNALLKEIEVFAAGTLNTVAATAVTAIVFKVKLGAITLATITTTAPAASQVNTPWNFTLYAGTTTAGASGAMESHGNLYIRLVAGAGADTVFSDVITAPVGTVDLTAAQTLQVTVALTGNAVSTNNVTQRKMVTRLLN